MKLAKKRTCVDNNTMSLFGFGDAAVAEISAPISHVNTDDLPEFDFSAFIESSTDSVQIPAIDQVVQPTRNRVSYGNSIGGAHIAVAAAPVIRNTKNYRLTTQDIPHGVSARMEANMQALQLRKLLSEEGRMAMPDEKKILARYSGWGGLSKAFMHSDYQRKLEALLSGPEYAACSSGMLTQHFTPDCVVDFMYAALVKLGVKPKRMLDPSLGTGIFPARIPKEWSDDVAIYGAEIDPVLASLTAQLLPDVKVHAEGFESIKYPDNTFDLVITNVPFSQQKTFDDEMPRQSLNLHNFFIDKALRKVRPGGVVAVITSSYTLDAKDEEARNLFACQAKLIAAARLPEWMFKATASTNVTADILIFRKYSPADMRSTALDWTKTEVQGEATVNEGLFNNNQWWLGTPRLTKGQFNMGWTADLDESAVGASMDRWIANLEENACALHSLSEEEERRTNIQIQYEHLRKLRFGSFAEHDGKIVEVQGNGDVVPIEISSAKAQRVMAYIGVRESAKRLLLLQLKAEEDAPVNTARYELNVRYDAFAHKYGAINSRYNRSLLKSDPDFPLVSALEVMDPEEEKAEKSQIMLRRTVRPRKAVEQSANATEALMVSLNESASINLQRVGELCGQTEAQVQQELVQEGRIYKNPMTGLWELSEIYLSGELLVKLQNAEFAAAENSEFGRNVDALKAAMPEPIAFKDISLQLGSTFIDAAYIEAFLDHLMNNESGKRAAEVIHIPEIANWKVKSSQVEFGNDKTRWGTQRMPARKLLEYSLNMMTPTIRDEKIIDGVSKYVINADQTLMAREKQMEMQEEFKLWIGRDESRAEAIASRYNRDFNSSRPVVMDGSHLTLPGLNEAITLRGHQKNGIWRGLVGGNTLVGHAVGAGKTLVGICIAMEAKRLGIRNSTLLTVPNNIVGQFSREFIQAYPCANLLVISSVDGKAERERLFARAATGGYDAIIMSHETFSKFGVSSEQLESVMQPMREALTRAQASANDRQLVKSLERRKKALDELSKRIEDTAKKCPFTMDMLGCDNLIVDECQAFKNLWYTTSMASIPGLPTAFSHRAFDMYVKVRALSVANNERGGVVFMSATPIANTIAEMFHLMRYMLMPTLVDKGIDNFDAWAANYGRTVVNIETTPDGAGFRLQTRFAKFENVPELMAMFGQFADIKTKEDLKLPVPKIAGGKPTVVAIPASIALKAYVQSLAARSDAIHSKDPAIRPDPTVDNMLKVTTDGRLAALDMRLVGGLDDPASKVNVAIGNMFSIWEQTKTRKLTQLVFMDSGTPGSPRCDLYNDIKEKLIAKGVPAAEIALAHDYATPSKKALLEARMNRGDIRITIASTSLMGIGTNVQRLLYASHELDCPWRPDQVEQRGGRIERQGNLNEEILMFRYVSEQSFDAYNWNLVEQKLRFILQVMTSNCTVRSIEDIETRALTVAEVKAIATGNPMVVERAVLQQKEAKLTSLERMFYSEKREAQMNLVNSGRNIALLQENLELVLKDVATVAAFADKGAIEIGGRKYTGEDREEVADALRGAFADTVALHGRRGASMRSEKTAYEVGNYRGLTLGIQAGRSIDGEYFEWCLQGSLMWGTELGNDWLGNYTRIRNLAERLGGEADKRRERLQQTEKAAADSELANVGTFPRATELQEVRQRLRALDDELGLNELDAQAAGVEKTAEEDETEAVEAQA